VFLLASSRSWGHMFQAKDSQGCNMNWCDDCDVDEFPGDFRQDCLRGLAVWLDANTHWPNLRKAETQASIKWTTLHMLWPWLPKSLLAVSNIEVNCTPRRDSRFKVAWETLIFDHFAFPGQGILSCLEAVFLQVLSCVFGTQRKGFLRNKPLRRMKTQNTQLPSSRA
jgi:hypothetical protein